MQYVGIAPGRQYTGITSGVDTQDLLLEGHMLEPLLEGRVKEEGKESRC